MLSAHMFCLICEILEKSDRAIWPNANTLWGDTHNPQECEDDEGDEGDEGVLEDKEEVFAIGREGETVLEGETMLEGVCSCYGVGEGFDDVAGRERPQGKRAKRTGGRRAALGERGQRGCNDSVGTFVTEPPTTMPSPRAFEREYVGHLTSVMPRLSTSDIKKFALCTLHSNIFP